jgi:hypothetical protein
MENIEEAKRRGLIRQDVDTIVAAWQFMAMGLGLDLIHALSFTDDIDRSAVEEWQRLYLSSVLEKPGDSRPEGRFVGVGFGMVEDWQELHLE